MTYSKPKQKLISFTDNEAELNKVAKNIKEGWNITSLIKNNGYYVGIMERNLNSTMPYGSVFIPPRKKIRLC